MVKVVSGETLKIGYGQGYNSPAPISKPDLSSWYWFLKMTEGSGTNVADTGTAGKDGTIQGGGPAWGTNSDMGGDVLDYPALTATSYVDMGAAAFNTIGTSGKSFTAVTLMKPDSLGTTGQYPRIFYFSRYVSASDRNGWELDMNYSGSGIRVIITTGGSAQTIMDTTHTACGITVGNIYCVMLVFDNPNNQIRLYVNGLLKNSATFIYNVGYHVSNYNRFGGASTGVNSFDGQFAWAAIDEVVHTDAQALTFYNDLGL